MGMGYGANYADVISDTDLATIVGEELTAFLNALDAADLSESDFIYNEYSDAENPEVVDTYNRLITTFEEKTGLGLYFDYHSEENGDRYDDVQGAFWAVDGMYELSEAGKKLENKVHRCSYVTFG